MDLNLLLLFSLAVAAIGAAYFFLSQKTGPQKRGKVEAIYIYPIKSTCGIKLESAEIGPFGFKHDREWMLIEEGGGFLSQRALPTMSLIKTKIDTKQGNLVVDAPGMSTLLVPLKPVEGEDLVVSVWGTEMGGIDQGAEASAWFSKYLNKSVKLVRLPADHDRQIEAEFANKKGVQVASYTDQYPFLVINRASMDIVEKETLEECKVDPVTEKRFRPNIIVSGFAPWEELLFVRARAGKAILYLSKPDPRCKLTTVLPDKGRFGDNKQPMEWVYANRKGIFGMLTQYDPSSEGVSIHVGDDFVVDQFREKEVSVQLPD